MHTDLPASANTWAAVAPPGPDPTTTTSKSGTRHLFVAPAARLHVALVADRAPAREVTVAAVLGWPVTRLARVLEQQILQLGDGVERGVLPVSGEVEEARAERGDSFPVDLL